MKNNLTGPGPRYLPDKDSSSRVFDKEDAELFMVLCQFVWVQGGPLPLIYEVENKIYTKQGINLPVLKHLEAIGLIFLDSGGYVKKRFGRHTRLFYHRRPTKIQFLQEANNQLDLGHVLLTDLGKSLAAVRDARHNPEFYEYVIEKWFQQGLVVSSILARR